MYSSTLNLSIKRATMLISENMTSFNITTNLTKPRIAECYEALLFTDNGGYFVVDGIKYEITKGTVRFLKPGQEVYSKRYKDAYVVYFTVEGNGEGALNKLSNKFVCGNYNQCVGIYRDIIKNYVNNDKKYYFKTYLLLLKLIDIFLNDSYNYNCNYKNQDIVANAKEFIEQNFSEKLSLADIAESVNLHPNYMHRLFKNKIGIAPISYLNEFRIKSAADLLVTTTLTVNEISELCGFDSPSYFITVFKKKVGATPFKYRIQYSQDVLL